ncbi:MAG: choice-of-anchor J domain-containing protein [Lentimicrobiaceae bacterium]|nr:choice-of-anchor J domain-containing protein [Lentimicrobiaceae bacterium]
MKKTLFKTICMTLLTVFCFMSLNAQMVRKSETPIKKVETSTLSQFSATSHHVSKDPNRNVVYFEGFESTSGAGGGLPTGWTQSHTGKWVTYANLTQVPGTGGTDEHPPHSGTRMMGKGWQSAGVGEWAFTAGFQLEAGTSYNISFWWTAMGWADYGEPDIFEVRIGQTATASGMSGATLVFNHPGTLYNFDFIWRNATYTFVPTTSGTYYLGFNDLRPYNAAFGGYGHCIMIDDIEVTGAGGPPPACDPATITSAVAEGTCNRINWTLPAKRDEVTLTQAGTYTGNAIGAGTATFEVYNRFTPTDLTGVANGQLHTVSFVPAHSMNPAQPPMAPTHNYKIKIYQGGSWVTGNRNPGTLVHEQTLTNANLTFNAENAITLTTPVTINASQELWIGYECINFGTSSTQFPAGADPGPRNEGLGNCMFYSGAWETLYELNSALINNWAIKGIVTTGTGPATATVNLYHNDNLVESNIQATTYLHCDPTGATHCYKVEVNCLEGGVSAMSNEECVEAGDCNPPRNLTADYVDGCTGVLLSWNPPAAKSSATPSNNTQSLETMRSGSSATTAQAEEMMAASVTSNNATRGTELLNESFPTGTVPAGWLNIDADGDGWKWQFELYANTAPFPPMPSEGRTDAYCINSASYYNGIGPLSPNNWLITPQLELTGNTELTWWIKVFDAGYRDKYGVFISTTGTNPSDFTEIFTETPPASQSTNWAQRTVTITQTGPCYIAFRHYGSVDLYILGLDDIIVTALTPTYYNIYRNDVLIQANHPGTTYTDNGANATQENTWKVTVACEGGGESAPASKKLEPCPTDCDPATITAVTPSGDGMYISWTYPAKRGEVIITQGGDFGNTGIGAGQASFSVYHRFTPAELTAVANGELSVVRFAPMYGQGQEQPGHSYKIKIYQGGVWTVPPGGGCNPGTLVHEQALNNSDIPFDGNEYDVILSTPVIIDASQELWIGYDCVNIPDAATQKSPAGVDPGPRKDNFGNVMFFNNAWTTLMIAGGANNLNYNWCIKGKVQVPIRTVNLYRDNVKILTNFEGTSHLDRPLPAGIYCYEVEVNCPNGSISPLSNKECETIGIKEVKSTFSIVPNPATNNITITAGNDFNGVEVISFLGQTVLAQSTNGNSVTLDISTLTNGVYFIRVISEEGVSVKKFVKQ